MGQLRKSLKDEFEELLKARTVEIQTLLENGQVKEAFDVVKGLQDARDQTLYQEVGKLTRALHDAIHNFNIDSSDESEQKPPSDMSDATDRLSYVVNMTEKAANKTMDLVEESMPVARRMGDDARSLHENWKKLLGRELNADQFRELYWEMDKFLQRSTDESEELYGNLSEILLAQDFQDLTGQVIQRVTNLVREVETSLVDLIFMASQVETITGVSPLPETESKKNTESNLMQGEGPQIDQTQDDVVTSQDDVDDLLSSLGF